MKPIEKIGRIVADYYAIDYDQLFWKTREKYIRKPRQIVQFLTRKHTDMSYATIAGFFNQDHLTAINSEKKVRDEMETNKVFRTEMDEIMTKMSREFLPTMRKKSTRKFCEPTPFFISRRT